MRCRYSTYARDLLRDALPRQGFLNIKDLSKKSGLPVSTVWYQLKKMKDVRAVKVGFKKHKYFMKTRIDKWIWMKIKRYARQGVLKLRNHLASLSKQAPVTQHVGVRSYFRAKRGD